MHIKTSGQLAYIHSISPANPTTPVSGFAAALGIRLLAFAAGQYCPVKPVPVTVRRKTFPAFTYPSHV
jgi:hypothetical protein